MPELPEVETIVRNYRPDLVGRCIVDFQSHWPKHVQPSYSVVQAALSGRVIESLDRRAKFILFRLGGGGLLCVHLRMSGRFAWARAGHADPPHVRAEWTLDDGRRLLFCDARKFGRIILTDDASSLLAALGPEPLDAGFTPRVLAILLRARRRQLKPLLLDQRVLAGLGNIYTDESLFYARLHPLTLSNRLSDEQVRGLHRAIRRVLRAAIERNGTTIDWAYPGGEMQHHLAVYGRAGEPCKRCSTPIVAIRVGQRGTHYCPACQPRERSSPRIRRAAPRTGRKPRA